MIETSVALHLLIYPHCPHPLPPSHNPHHETRSLHLPSHLTTSRPRTILPASLNSQLSANGCGIGEASVSSISPLAFVLTSAKLDVSSSNNSRHTGRRMNGSLKVVVAMQCLVEPIVSQPEAAAAEQFNSFGHPWHQAKKTVQ